MSQSRDNAKSVEPSGLRRVLVVQNEPTLRLGFSYALANASMRVETASSGQETLEQMASSHFDLIILELRMPGIDGIEVIEKLRARGDETAVVLCTMMHRPNATLRAIRLGVVDYLVKPVRPPEVRQVVEWALTPGPDRFSQAMKSARSRSWDEAISLLGKIDPPKVSELHWLRVLRLIRDSHAGDDESKLEEEVRSSFPFLAFNATEGS